MGRERRLADARTRWQDLWARLGATTPPERAFDELIAEYDSPHRHYHTFDHILACLELLDRYAHLARNPAEVEIAIWFHDAVYDTHRGDNEAASAEWSARVMAGAGVPMASIERVRRMILATCHQAPPESRDERLMLDIDLSILGQEPARFSDYEQGIRREFDWVPEDAFRRGRSKVLSGFLGRAEIFSTAEFHSAFERKARANLASAVGRLGRPGSLP